MMEVSTSSSSRLFGCQSGEIALAIQCRVVVGIRLFGALLFTLKLALLTWRGSGSGSKSMT